MVQDETMFSRFRRLHERRFGQLWLKAIALGLGLLICFELMFFIWIWPDWDALRQGKVPPSALIEEYEKARRDNSELAPLKWSPIVKAFPKSIKKVFVLAEDSRFYEHDGIDLPAILEAVAYNYRHGKVLRGASTISQQTAKNMFLSLSRNPLRKWHELLMTFFLETHLTKEQILHIYLNVAEFGPGVFGLEAAAKHYYKSSAQGLSVSQAVELAAALPSPKKHNPKQRTTAYQKRVQRIGQTMQVVERVAAEPLQSSAVRQELEKNLDELRRELKENPIEQLPAGGESPTLKEPTAQELPPDPGNSQGEVEGAAESRDAEDLPAAEPGVPPAEEAEVPD